MVKIDVPPLAHYRPMAEYQPHYGDYVVWAGLITCWHGVVSDYNENTNELSVIFAGLPCLLFTLTVPEQEKATYKIQLATIMKASNGTYAIHQHDKARNVGIWYI